MEQEAAYVSTLTAAQTFQIDGSQLVISGSAGDLTFAAQ
jgi:hypothetical protein